MRGSELVEAMAIAIDLLVSAREGKGALDRGIETIVSMIGWFGGKNVKCYLEAYRAKMIMRDIPENGQLSRSDDGLTIDWALVKRVCGHFDKRREWSDEGSWAARLARREGSLRSRYRRERKRLEVGLSRAQPRPVRSTAYY